MTNSCRNFSTESIPSIYKQPEKNNHFQVIFSCKHETCKQKTQSVDFSGSNIFQALSIFLNF